MAGEAVRAMRAAATALLFFTATVLHAVPGPLDAYHYPLNPALKSYLREEQRYEGSRELVRRSVKYAGIKAYDPWKDYLKSLARADSSRIKAASEPDRKAFWINTYNAYVLDTVIQHHPIRGAGGGAYPSSSIQSIAGVWDAPHPVAGASYSLRAMEGILRDMTDPRVWFALSPASRGGPSLSANAYNSTWLEEQLEAAANGFCYNRENVRVDTRSGELRLSSLFRDHAVDFAVAALEIPPELRSYPAAERAVVAFVVQRMPAADRRYVLNRHPKVVYLPMDWELNEAK